MGEGRLRFKQEKRIEHFLGAHNGTFHNGTHEDIKVQIIDHPDLNDQEAGEDF